MQDNARNRRGQWIPMAVAAVVAVTSTATFLFMEFAPKNDIQANGVSMITTAVVYRAGATLLPSDTTR